MFKLHSSYVPTGDQPDAINSLVDGIEKGYKHQVLLGATGTGKTYTMANVIARVNKPTLVLAHNKTLAGQLYAEFKELFPENHVEYFISYYDYYQPEAYVVKSDTYIEKEATINDEIDEMRHLATVSLLEHRDTIIVASVSCIYGIGDPDDYKNSLLVLQVGGDLTRKKLLNRLVDMLFKRNEMDYERGSFRAKGEIVEIIPTYEGKHAIRVEFDFDEIKRIRTFDYLTGEVIAEHKILSVYPATQFVTNKDKLALAIERIRNELEERVHYFNKKNMPLEAERISQRTKYDIEMLEEMGTCNGVENYSRHLSLRDEGETPSVLIDFFPDDFLLMVDESHVTLPQVRGMYNGDRSRKMNLVEYGFRLPSSLDNRPLNFDEFNKKINQAIYVSATPAEYELGITENTAEQIIRPTGLLDPVVEVKKTENQIDDIVRQIDERIKNNERILITTLTIKMSEDLTNYLKGRGYKVQYLHSEIKALERLDIITDLRLGTFDILVGINLLREGLDIPEVSLILILDADKEGFLRSSRSLIQTIGRAARNANGKVVLYADNMTEGMDFAIKETNRRRAIQMAYNEKHNITPKTIIKPIREKVVIKTKNEKGKEALISNAIDIEKTIKNLNQEMLKAAKELDFERAMEIRDLIYELKSR